MDPTALLYAMLFIMLGDAVVLGILMVKMALKQNYVRTRLIKGIAIMLAVTSTAIGAHLFSYFLQDEILKLLVWGDIHATIFYIEMCLFVLFLVNAVVLAIFLALSKRELPFGNS